jgi:hypothetical protein
MKNKKLHPNTTKQILTFTKLNVLSLKEMILIKGGDGTPTDEILPPPPPPGKD